MPTNLSMGQTEAPKSRERPKWKVRPDGHAYKALDIGAERIRPTGEQKKPIWFVKVSNELCSGENKKKAPYQWEKKHLWLWKKYYGDIPSGHKIVFLNGDTLDCRIENLYMATDAAVMMMVKNKWFSSEPEITKTAILCCELEIVTKKEKKKNEEVP